MKTFFDQYIDVTVLTLCLSFSVINIVRMLRQATVPIRKVPGFLLVFGATAIATFLGVGHLFEISFHAVERSIAGTYVFDFRFYSLILLGMVLLSLSVRMLGDIKALFRGESGSQRRIIKTVFLIVAVSAPTGLFTPIGYVPSIACAISMLGLPFVRKSQTAGRQVTEAPTQEVVYSAQ